MGNKTNQWLKKIFSVTTLTTIATIVGACIAIVQYVEGNGGTFLAFVNNEEATPPVNKTILVYLDKDSADLSQIGIFPQITNPSKYSLQDVLLNYKIESNSADISYTDYFSVHRLASGFEVTNVDKTLYAKTDMPEPFFYFIMKDNGQANIDIRATYKGVDEPFTFKADVYSKKIYVEDQSLRRQLIFDDARLFFANSQINNVDVFILFNDKVESYENMTHGRLDTLSHDVGQATSVKEIDQINTEKKALSASAQEDETMPWYMYVLVVILCLALLVIFFIGILLCVLNETKDIGYAKFVLGSILSIFVSYVCFYYIYRILDPDLELNFIAGLLYIFLFAVMVLLIRWVSKIIINYLSINNSESAKEWVYIIVGGIFCILYTVILMFISPFIS